MKLGYIVYIGYIFMCATILNFHRATHVFLIQNESYRQSLEKTKNNGEYQRKPKLSGHIKLNPTNTALSFQ